jgi:hypothetical protein
MFGYIYSLDRELWIACDDDEVLLSTPDDCVLSDCPKDAVVLLQSKYSLPGYVTGYPGLSMLYGYKEKIMWEPNVARHIVPKYFRLMDEPVISKLDEASAADALSYLKTPGRTLIAPTNNREKMYDIFNPVDDHTYWSRVPDYEELKLEIEGQHEWRDITPFRLVLDKKKCKRLRGCNPGTTGYVSKAKPPALCMWTMQQFANQMCNCIGIGEVSVYANYMGSCVSEVERMLSYHEVVIGKYAYRKLSSFQYLMQTVAANPERTFKKWADWPDFLDWLKEELKSRIVKRLIKAPKKERYDSESHSSFPRLFQESEKRRRKQERDLRRKLEEEANGKEEASKEVKATGEESGKEKEAETAEVDGAEVLQPSG